MYSRRMLMLALVFSGRSLHAQHEGHDMSAMDHDMGSGFHLMVQAIPLVSRADPTAGSSVRTQLALTQTLAMLRAAWWDNRLSLDATLNAEGVTMREGELNTGAAGEGFVDKRHPHTYVHELVGSLRGDAATASYALSLGRGFAPFGTDDPMVRPFAKYPLNHHLSQILERGVGIASLRTGAVIFEGGIFDGDEPTSPSSTPRVSRFGDSWSSRVTVLPADRTELQASYARVASPEQVDGNGLDQRKQSVSARTHTTRGVYGLVEWSRAVERDHTRGIDAFAYESMLAEGSVTLGRSAIGLRLEQTERPEEDRLADPFRTPRPSSDLSINGITRWRVATVHAEAPGVTHGWLSGFPFMEVARLNAAARDARSLFTPQRLYGSTNFWLVSAGLRLRAGGSHDRMGRYGAATTP